MPVAVVLIHFSTCYHNIIKNIMNVIVHVHRYVYMHVQYRLRVFPSVMLLLHLAVLVSAVHMVHTDEGLTGPSISPARRAELAYCSQSRASAPPTPRPHARPSATPRH